MNGVTATQFGACDAANKGSVWLATIGAGTGTFTITSGVFGVVSSAGYVVTTTHPTPSSSLSLNDMVNGGDPPGQTLTTAVTIPTSGVDLIFAAGSKAGTVAPVCTWTGGVTNDAVLGSCVGTGAPATAPAVVRATHPLRAASLRRSARRRAGS
jgi:hypothetical protein